MTISLPACWPAVALGLLLAGCSSATEESATVTSAQAPGAAATQPFVGTIRLLEHRYVLGIRRTDYITLTFDGPRLRREVRTNSFADSTERYGIIADLRTDSVTYYVQDATRNAHYRMARRDYLARVAANEPIFAPLPDRKPYSTIFEAVPPNSPGLRSTAVAGPALRRLSSFQAVLFVLPDLTRCDVFYSELVRVPRAGVACLVHQAPVAVPTLPLGVSFTPPPQPNSTGLLDRVQRRLSNLFSQDSELESFEPTVADGSFRLPAGSTNNLAEMMEAAASSSSHHHHHH